MAIKFLQNENAAGTSDGQGGCEVRKEVSLQQRADGFASV